ncbi:MAG: hypothetical protein QW279_05270 [Candidatus Jordarchaeaceae archaeon]
MGEKYLRLGLVGSIVGVFTFLEGLLWFSNLASFYSEIDDLQQSIIYSQVGFDIVISKLDHLFFWTVITFGSFMVCGILMGIGFHGMRSLEVHRMEVVSLIAGVALSPLVFIFNFLSTHPPTSSWLYNVMHYWSLVPSPNGFLFFIFQILFTIILLVFASTLIITRRTTGRPETALTSGTIIIILGTIYITMLAIIHLSMADTICFNCTIFHNYLPYLNSDLYYDSRSLQVSTKNSCRN